ncbi:MAG TPA: TetR/AcrR family transcriptional regulator [Solirubrobacterales bacterium]|nr:TetR/AcrR family transcriptional regulator [Solirubrobacterales bacterium]
MTGAPATAIADPPEPNTRERILAAAVGRIATEGIDDVRIARIAQDAGVSPALIHYHFDSRETLLAEALQYSYDLLGNERILEWEAGPATTAKRLWGMVETYLPLPGDQHRDWMLWAELWLRAIRHPELRPTSARLYGEMHAWIRDTVAAGIESGEVSPVDPETFADCLLALIDGCGVRVLMGDPEMSLERMRSLTWTYVVEELGLEEDREGAERREG